MCGITGMISTKTIDSSLIKNMSKTIYHRGPDSKGFYIEDKIIMANTRLSIIDLEGGYQPMVSDDGVVIVYNGEIYNFKELRQWLVDRGIKFNSESDTEVILKLYEALGVDCFKLLNGMFAIAIFDNGQLFLARDRSGIKPLYYHLSGDGKTLFFGSEIKTILAAGVKRELNINGFHSFLNLRFVPDVETMFKDIFRLKAGTFMIWDKDFIEIENYWKPNVSNRINSLDHASKLLNSLLPKAMGRHMISDVEVGAYLSGGIDSSTIVHYASEFSDNLKTFTLGFNQETDETKKAKRLSEHYGTDHHELFIEDRFMTDAPEILWHSEFPKRNLYPYYLAKLANRKVKVVLSGLGSDELFCGYTWKYDAIRNSNSKPKYEIYTDKISLDQIFDTKKAKYWYGPKLNGVSKISDDIKPIFDIYEPERAVQLADYQIKMVGDFLHVDDTTSMAHSLETRTPFLDNSLIDFAFSIPTGLHYSNKGKDVLRASMSDKLPTFSLDSPKQGFSISLSNEYTAMILEYSKSLLVNGHTVKQKLLQPHIFENLEKRNKLDVYTLWNLLYFEVWYEIFFERQMIEKPNKTLDQFLIQ